MGTRNRSGRQWVAALVCILVFGSVLVLTPAGAQVTVPDPRPNILIILTDDQRLEGTMAVLPHVDRWLAEGGRTFTDAFSTTPLCCPSRTTILTGRYAHNHGILDNAATNRSVLDQSTMLPRYLQDSGYRTAYFGKLFNFWRVEDDPAFFDRWAIVSPTRTSNGYVGGTWNVQGTLRMIDRYSTDYIASQGIRFIREAEAADAQPWFLELATYAPHLKALPAPSYVEAPVGRFHPTPAMTEVDRSDKPPFVRAEQVELRSVATARERQLRALKSVDDLVARIAQVIRRTGESRDTLVVFLSDNALLWGEHGLRSKGYPYGPGVRIPLLLRWPTDVEEATVDHRLVATVDVAPTIMDAAGIAPDPSVPMDGHSLLDPTWDRDLILLEFWPWTGSSAPRWASIWGATYQYTEYYADDGKTVFREFYDLVGDPWQLTNLLHDGDPVNDPSISELHERLMVYGTCAGTACP